jgi:hypothetical protein
MSDLASLFANVTAAPDFVPTSNAVLNNPARPIVASAEAGVWYPLGPAGSKVTEEMIGKVRSAAGSLDRQVQVRPNDAGIMAFRWTGKPIARRNKSAK